VGGQTAHAAFPKLDSEPRCRSSTLAGWRDVDVWLFSVSAVCVFMILKAARPPDPPYSRSSLSFVIDTRLGLPPGLIAIAEQVIEQTVKVQPERLRDDRMRISLPIRESGIGPLAKHSAPLKVRSLR
jgi:hypothetical protein